MIFGEGIGFGECVIEDVGDDGELFLAESAVVSSD